MTPRQNYHVTPGRVTDFRDHLLQMGVTLDEQTGPAGPAQCLEIQPDQWGRVAETARSQTLRWSAVWGEHRPPQILITAVLSGSDGHLLLRTRVPEERPELPSHTPHFPAANRPERHLQDMFGVRFSNHPDPRRWIRHRAWGEDVFPLRKEFPLAGTPLAKTPPDSSYPFVLLAGEGVCEVPVGPVHAGIIEPGHFRFQVIGEDVLRLEERLGYVHKGIEKLAEGRDLAGLVRLAGRVSGDSTVTHSWAACQAAERALGVEPPPRALTLRAIMAERERIANHMGDIGASCNDVGFSFALVQFSRLRELWQRQNAAVFGHRLLMDRVIPGGVACDLKPGILSVLREELAEVRRQVEELMPMLLEYPSLQDRFRTTGILTPEMAQQLGTIGYVGRASNQQDDLRRDAPYAPYDTLTVEVPAYIEGDVAKRVRVRGDEILVSLDLIEKLLNKLPDGPVAIECAASGEQCEGIGLVEGWRGETIAYLRLDALGNVMRYFPRDPSWLNWPALEELIHNNIVPDFPVCNKSVNGSYSGHDL
jgi:Ni,Fe-hydrogenase III large subunit/NADH:ubiquinone oxidoreductase subunit C